MAYFYYRPKLQKESYTSGTASNVITRVFREGKLNEKRIQGLVNQRRNQQDKPGTFSRCFDWHDLSGAINRLNQRHQQIIHLRYVQEFKTQEIAELLDIPHVNVRVQLLRALRRLRTLLQPQ